jgi:hypothetical protein
VDVAVEVRLFDAIALPRSGRASVMRATRPVTS